MTVKRAIITVAQIVITIAFFAFFAWLFTKKDILIAITFYLEIILFAGFIIWWLRGFK
jgi:hypothetical protein